MPSPLSRDFASRAFARFLLAVIAAWISIAPAFASIDSANNYLLSQQNTDGSFAGTADLATHYQATAQTLGAVDATASQRDAAVAFLRHCNDRCNGLFPHWWH